ncbi:hypothetical protein DYQ86_00910 [Acidobacteria bacterium AB60]|nr:hypothetical protein DYQ86_00910 [Acidobacteria bacterium AB60]
MAGTLLAAPTLAHAANCTTQAEMTPTDRDALAAAAQRLGIAVINQDMNALQSALLPAVVRDWDGIRSAIEQGAPDVKGGQVQLRNLYLMDATSLKAPEDTQFFCSNANGSTTVTISMRALPPGRYAIALADAPGSPLAGQMAFILGWDANAWKLGGAFVRPGMLGGHDGVWYWEHARQMTTQSPWVAYFCYEAAHYLLLPVDFISSPNLEKLEQEQGQLKNSPAEAFPYSVTAGDRTWKVQGMRFDPSLREADVEATYESAGVSDPAAQRTEAIAVLGALLKAQPMLRQSFHGMWAYAANAGKVTPIMELPMAQIP